MEQRSVSAELSACVGAIVLATTMALGVSGCAKPVGSEGEAGGADASETAETAPDPTTETDTDTGTTLGDTSDSSSSSADTSLSFYAGPDIDLAPIYDCDPFEQDCPEGEKCVPYGSTGGNWDSNKCVAVTGDGSPGDPCIYGGTVEASDDCGPDSHCWDVTDVDGMPIGVCTEFCQGTVDAPLCPEGTTCLVANSGSITLCVATCDPLAQDCEGAKACYWAFSQFECVFTTSDLPLGEACGFVNDCAGGMACVAAEYLPDCSGDSCCASFCSLAAPVCTQPGTECAAFFDVNTAPAEYADVGVCVGPGA